MLMLALFAKTFFAVFGVMDPVGNVPVYLTLIGTMDRKQARAIALRAVLRAGVILVAFVFLGNALLDVFHVSIQSFQIAGGLILVLLGLQIVFNMNLRGTAEPEADTDISVVPLATPLIAGPGMITTAVILSKEYGHVATLISIAANLVLSYILFHYAHLVLKLLGKRGALAFAKIIGLVLVSIGVEFIRSGLM